METVLVSVGLVVVIVTDVESSFYDCLMHLMPVLVGRGQLVVKEVHGAKLTGKDLAQYFKVAYISLAVMSMFRPVSLYCKVK